MGFGECRMAKEGGQIPRQALTKMADVTMETCSLKSSARVDRKAKGKINTMVNTVYA